MEGNREAPVGRLVSQRVFCVGCCSPDADVPIYRVNIYPYRQNCAGCGRVLVEGQTASWPELFTGGRS